MAGATPVGGDRLTEVENQIRSLAPMAGATSVGGEGVVGNTSTTGSAEIQASVEKGVQAGVGSPGVSASLSSSVIPTRSPNPAETETAVTAGVQAAIQSPRSTAAQTGAVPTASPQSFQSQEAINSAGEAAAKKASDDSLALEKARAEMDSAVKERDATAKTKKDFSDVNGEPYKDKVRQDFLGASSVIEQARTSNKELNPGNLSEEGLVGLSKNETAMKIMRDAKKKDDEELASGKLGGRMGYSADRKQEITNRANTLKAVDNLPEIQKNNANVREFSQIRDRGVSNDQAKLGAYSSASERLPALDKKVEEKKAAFNKLNAKTPGAVAAGNIRSTGLEARMAQEEYVKGLRPKFLDQQVVTKDKSGKVTGSRQATAKDVAKSPEEFRKLQAQQREYNTARTNLAYDKAGPLKVDEETGQLVPVKQAEAKAKAEFLKKNPQVADLSKKQAAERNELAQKYSSTDEEGKPTTGIRTAIAGEGGYDKEKILQFKVASAELKAKQDEEMKQTMAGGGPLGGSGMVKNVPASGAATGPSDISKEEEIKAKSKYGYDTQSKSFANKSDEAGYNSEIEKIKNQKLAQSSGVTPGAQPGAPVMAQQPAAAEKVKAQEQNKVQANTQQDTSQLISSILAAVQQISTTLTENNNKQAAGPAGTGSPAGATPDGGGGGGGVSVSTPVSFTVTSANGESADASKQVAEQIKSGLTEFLSSSEFISKVTSIANGAAGVKTPPKQPLKGMEL